MENIHIRVECTFEDIYSFTYIFKELCDIVAWSYEHIPSIEPSIVEYEIMNYVNSKPIQQRLRPVDPC